MCQDRDAFTEALEMELRLRGFALDRWALSDFVRGSTPLVEEDPDPAAWAQIIVLAGPRRVNSAA